MARNVGVEHQALARRIGPSPCRDAINEPAHCDGGMGVNVGPDGAGGIVAALGGPSRGPGEERLDVSALQPGDRAQPAVVVAHELAEHGQGDGELLDGLGSQDGGPDIQVSQQGPADLGRGDPRQPRLARGRCALASVLGREIDHAGLEQQTAEPE